MAIIIVLRKEVCTDVSDKIAITEKVTQKKETH